MAGFNWSNVWIWLHGMKFVLFREQHWPNYVGGCSIVYTKNCSILEIPLLWFFIRTLAERKWHCCVVVSLSPGENGREHYTLCSTQCSINAPFFVLPDCSTSLSCDYPGYFPHLLTNFFHGVTAGASQVRRGTIGPLGVTPGHWTAGSSCLEEGWRWYLGRGL